MCVSEGVSEAQNQPKMCFPEKKKKEVKWTSLISVWSGPEQSHSKVEV